MNRISLVLTEFYIVI